MQAWPTLVIIGPDGNVLGQLAGEPDPVKFPQVIGILVDAAGKNGDLKPAKLALKLEEEPKGRFLFPGNLKSVPGATPQWALADAGHNQIVAARRRRRGRETFRQRIAAVSRTATRRTRHSIIRKD